MFMQQVLLPIKPPPQLPRSRYVWCRHMAGQPRHTFLPWLLARPVERVQLALLRTEGHMMVCHRIIQRSELESIPGPRPVVLSFRVLE